MLKQHSIDLFLLDISMPGTNGWQLLESLRNQGYRTPVIILSAAPYEDVNMYQNKADFQAYINKPIRLEKLLEQVKRCVDVQWRECDASEYSAGETGESDHLPSQVSFSTLLEYAKVGYLKGVCECIETIESLHPPVPLASRLREMADLCDMSGIIRLIEELEVQTEPC